MKNEIIRFQSAAEKYLDARLLIIDDLGTEFSNQFTLSTLYNLLNARQNKGLATIISTNLSMDQIRQRYTAQIASRIEGLYRELTFYGQDIRLNQH